MKERKTKKKDQTASIPPVAEEATAAEAAKSGSKADRTKERILQAAIVTFSEKGFDGSRTKDIAERAGVAEGTIFRYFKTKRDLLFGLLAPIGIRVAKPLLFRSLWKIMENKEKLPFEEVLAKMIADRKTLVEDRFDLIKTAVAEGLHQPEILEPVRAVIMPEILKVFGENYGRLLREGTLRDVGMTILLRAVMSVIIGEVLLPYLFPEVFPADDGDIRRLADLIANGAAARRPEA